MRILFYVRGVVSLGAGYILSTLQQKGHSVELLFDPGLDNNLYYRLQILKFVNKWPRLIRRAIEWKPDLVAFSVPSNVYPFAIEFAWKLKKHLAVPFVFGGPHPTALPEYVMANDEVDYVCRGEGEQMMAELAECLEKKKSARNIKNLCYKEGGEVHVNPLRPLVEDLDRLPFPNRDLYYREGAFRSLLHIITSRGCPFRCTYCINSFLKNKLYREFSGRVPYVRHRSPENVIAEIKECVARYPIREIFFCDEVFVIQKNWLFRFLDLYKREIGGIPFSFSYYHRFIDAEVARRLAAAGAVYAQGAIETANEDIRRNVLKRVDTNESILRAMQVLQGNGIKVSTSAIFGIPRETKEARWETVRLVEKSKPDMINTYLMYPFPGTEILEMAQKEGYISPEGYQKALAGVSSYHQDSLLQNLDIPNATTMAKLLPLYIRGPRFVKPLVGALMKTRLPRLAHFLYVATTPLLYSGWARQWIGDLLRMLLFRLTGKPGQHAGR
jgi:radical SAM superfamily enzyme YgiQ (UPF0313 family)